MTFNSINRRICFIATLISSFLILAQASVADTKIVISIEEKQKERKSTQFNLTEWLLIKERIKAMDVWLAMNTKPDAKFTPELALYYREGTRTISSDLFDSTDEKWRHYGAELWLTNIVSALTGWNTWNIDIGFSGHYGESIDGFLLEGNTDTSSDNNISFDPSRLRYGLDLRLLGNHSQDSSLIVSYGTMQDKKSVAALDSDDLTKINANGNFFSTQLKMYLASFFGVQVQYTTGWLDGPDDISYDAESYNYGAFVDLFIFQLEFYQYFDQDKYKTGDKIKSDGFFAGLKVLL